MLTSTPTQYNEPKKTQHNNNMVADQVLCDLSVRRTVCVHGVCSVPRGSAETVQAWVQHGQDGRRQQGPDSEVQVVRNSISFSRVSVQCQLRWESFLCRVKATSTVVHLNDHTCECDSGFELKSTARVVAYQLPSTMLGTCSPMPLSPRKLSSTSVMCSACRVSSVTTESKRGICRTTSGARPREHCAMRAIRPQRIPSTDSQHQLSRRFCISRA